MAKTITNVSQVKFNKMSQKKYEALKKADELVENEFYITPDYLNGGIVKDDIGNIVLTTKISLSDGENWCDGSTHTKSEFPEYYDKLVNNELASVDFTTFDANPACGVSGLDITTETFKFPKIEDVYIKIGANYNETYGAESLPNITGNYGCNGGLGTTGAMYSNSAVTNGYRVSTTSPEVPTLGFDASRSSSTYQDGAKVNPDHITLKAYVITKPSVSGNNSNGGLEIGDIGIAPLGIDESQNLRRYLNGQVISQSQFKSFTNKVKMAIQLYPNLATTEENWQTEVTNSPYGLCGKFVIDDSVGTIRLPKYPDWSIREVGTAPVVGNGMVVGVTDGSKNYGTGSYDAHFDFREDNYGKLIGQSTEISGTYPTNGGALGITTDPTKSGMIADLVNANIEDRLYGKWFIQVATGVEESIDVSKEIQLNNPFFLGMSQYFENEPNNLSWLKSDGQFKSGYDSYYKWLLKIHNGTETVEGVSVKLSPESYDDYDFVLNTTDETFRLPLLNGSEYLPNYNWNITQTFNPSDSFTAPSNGWIRFSRSTSVAGRYLNFYIDGVYIRNAWSVSAGGGNAWLLFIKKGQVFTYNTDYDGSDTNNLSFAKAQGNGSLYYYVGETIQDANIINAAGVLTKVSNCIDRTMASDRELVINWGMHDYSAGINITSLPYTAPTDGVISMLCLVNNGFVVLKLNNNNILIADTSGDGVFEKTIRVEKGDVLTTSNVASATVPYNRADRNEYSMFYPLKGVK